MINFNISKGIVEYYYCFDLKDKKNLKYISEKLADNLCNMIKKEEKEEKEITLKDEYENYLSGIANQKKIEMSKNINDEIAKANFQDKIKVLNPQKNVEDNILDEISIDIDRSELYVELTDKGFNINFKNTEEEFIICEIHKFLENCNQDKKYLGSEMIADLFFFQPISVKLKDHKGYICACATLHTSGQLIVKYSLEIENISSEEFCLDKFSENHKCKIPNYIICDNKKIEYSSQEVTIKEAIKLYNEYIMKSTMRHKKLLLKIPIFFENLILEEYEKKPQDFNGVSKDLKESLYFIINRPYGYVNDRYSEEYDMFIKNRHDISRYASIFCGTSRRMLIAYNKSFDRIDEEIRTSLDRGYIASIYASAAIKLLIINRVFYDDVFKSTYEDIKNIKTIQKIQRELLFCQDFNFFNLRESYGSLKQLYNYMESNLTDFFPKDILDKKVEVYNKIIDSNYNIEKEKLNRRISLGAVIVTVLFGLSGIEKLIADTKLSIITMISNIFGQESVNILNNYVISIRNKIPLLEGVSFYFIIWVFLCIAMVVFFYKEQITKNIKSIIRTLKFIFNYIRFKIKSLL